MRYDRLARRTREPRYAARLEENAAAARVQLSGDDLRRISDAFPVGAAAGTRYTEGGMRTVNR